MKLTWSRWRRDLLAGLIGAGITAIVLVVLMAWMAHSAEQRALEAVHQAEQARRQALEAEAKALEMKELAQERLAQLEKVNEIMLSVFEGFDLQNPSKKPPGEKPK